MAFLTNLVSHWPFETSGNIGKDNYGSNHLTNVSSVVQAGGIINNAASFSGSNYLTISDNASLSFPNTSWTIVCWVYPTTLSTFHTIWGKHDSAAPNTGEYLIFWNHLSSRLQLAATADGSTYTSVVATPATNTSTWQMVEAYFDYPNTTLGLTLDNGTADTGSLTNTYDGTHTFRLGVNENGGAWVGYIDEVYVWRRLLTSDERTLLYGGGSGYASRVRRSTPFITFL